MPPEKLRILIIDDEECIRDSLAMHLSSLGHEVLTYETPVKCPAFKTHNCHMEGPCADIIFVDQNMPGMSGLEYLKHLTHHGCLVLPPHRIMMTGDVTLELKSEIKRMGAQIVQKPLRFETLEEIINNAKVFISSDRVLSDL